MDNNASTSSTSSTLKPDVKQMLEIGLECGLNHLAEAYAQYMSHYDCFFLIEKFAEQIKTFLTQLNDYGFLIGPDSDGNYDLKDLTIEQSLAIINASPASSIATTSA